MLLCDKTNAIQKPDIFHFNKTKGELKYMNSGSIISLHSKMAFFSSFFSFQHKNKPYVFNISCCLILFIRIKYIAYSCFHFLNSTQCLKFPLCTVGSLLQSAFSTHFMPNETFKFSSSSFNTQRSNPTYPIILTAQNFQNNTPAAELCLAQNSYCLLKD